MTLYGYARVSTIDQDLAVQEERLRAAGCRIVRAEKRSGAAREGQGSRMRGCGPMHGPALKKPLPAKPRSFQSMPKQTEPIFAWDQEGMALMREPCTSRPPRARG